MGVVSLGVAGVNFVVILAQEGSVVGSEMAAHETC
jgi:hypothetical protein